MSNEQPAPLWSDESQSLRKDFIAGVDTADYNGTDIEPSDPPRWQEWYDWLRKTRAKLERLDIAEIDAALARIREQRGVGNLSAGIRKAIEIMKNQTTYYIAAWWKSSPSAATMLSMATLAAGNRRTKSAPPIGKQHSTLSVKRSTPSPPQQPPAPTRLAAVCFAYDSPLLFCCTASHTNPFSPSCHA
jgi:hypothetical protein